MPFNTPPALPIARLHLTVRADAPLTLPPYAGSMLRGAWGHGLLALSPLPHHSGRACALHRTCAYCQVFAPVPTQAHSLQKFSQMPAPYVIEPPALGIQQIAAGASFRFGLVLIGRAWQHLPILLQAWQTALKRGLGSGNTYKTSPCSLMDVALELPSGQHHSIWQQGQNWPQPQVQDLPPLPAVPTLGQQVQLHFHTPLRLQEKSTILRPEQLNARKLLIALAKRWQLLLDTQSDTPAPAQLPFTELAEQALHIACDNTQMERFNWGRYSQHQQREMQLNGSLGALTLMGQLAPFAQLLHLGQWLHVGKNASFGLGAYQLVSV